MYNHIYNYIILLGIVMMAFLSCKTIEHTWFKSPDHSIEGVNIEILNIRDEFKAMYINKLENFDYIILTRDEVDKMILSSLLNDNDESYFIIVRALYTVLGGTYSAILNNKNELLISYKVLSRRGYRNKKDVLLLKLEVPPKDVYITSRIIR